MSIEWEFDLHLDRVDEAVKAAIPVALGKAIEHVRGEAVKQTPVESGNLAGSAGVTVTGNEASLLYPGPYARNQHESMDFHHNHGNAKFLELPMMQEAPRVIQIITDELGKVI
jgi:hypothetical protein